MILLCDINNVVGWKCSGTCRGFDSSNDVAQWGLGCWWCVSFGVSKILFFILFYSFIFIIFLLVIIILIWIDIFNHSSLKRQTKEMTMETEISVPLVPSWDSFTLRIFINNIINSFINNSSFEYDVNNY